MNVIENKAKGFVGAEKVLANLSIQDGTRSLGVYEILKVTPPLERKARLIDFVKKNIITFETMEKLAPLLQKDQDLLNTMRGE